jgi:DNA-binding NarL/FixJ family response regulator
MHRCKPRARVRKALIVQGQRLMLPFITDVLQRAGVVDVVAYHSASEITVRRARPDIVVLDVDAPGMPPLELIRKARQNTAARIVVLTRTEDKAWNALALAFGADRVLGPRADRQDLFTAVAVA